MLGTVSFADTVAHGNLRVDYRFTGTQNAGRAGRLGVERAGQPDRPPGRFELEKSGSPALCPPETGRIDARLAVACHGRPTRDRSPTSRQSTVTVSLCLGGAQLLDSSATLRP